MNRRTLLGRFLTIVAAVAAAPAFKVEAASSPKLTQAEIDALYVKAYGQEKVDSWAPPRRDTGILIEGPPGWTHPLKIIGADAPLSEWLEPVVVEDWTPGHAWADTVTPEFEAMRADCAAQNHVLWSMDFEDGTHRVWHDDDTIGLIKHDDLAYVDAWRRSLHGEMRTDEHGYLVDEQGARIRADRLRRLIESE